MYRLIYRLIYIGESVAGAIYLYSALLALRKNKQATFRPEVEVRFYALLMGWQGVGEGEQTASPAGPRGS